MECLPPMTAAEVATRIIDAAGGYPIHRSVLGHNWVFQIADAPKTKYIRHLRGVADGLKADNYDWKRIARPFLHKTTLEFLRACRDFEAVPMITANMRGMVDPAASPDVYVDTSAESLARQAADWAHYCNHILQTYREGDAVEEERASRILSELAWGGSDVLLAPGESMVPRVRYWQIGNEPHNHAGYTTDGQSYFFSEIPEVYVRNYRAVSDALKVEDSSNMVGPCFDSWDVRGSMRPERKYVPALFRSDAIIDCIWYQPYIDGHGVWPDESRLASTLRETAAYVLEEHHDRIVSHLIEAGRDPNAIEFGTSEFNFSCWYGSSTHHSQARMLGIGEMLFAQIEHAYVTASTWDAVCEHGVEWPVFKFMRAMHDHMGDVLVDVYRQDPLRLYTMRDRVSGRLSFWALNLGREDRRLRIVLERAPGCANIQASRLGNRSGKTRLTDRNTLVEPECVAWSEAFALHGPAADHSIAFTVPGYELMLVTADTRIPRTESRAIASRPLRTAVAPDAHRQPPVRTSCAFLYPTIEPLPAAVRLKTLRVEDGGVVVEWSANEADADWYFVQRDDGDGSFRNIGIADRGKTSLVDRHLAASGSYTYRVISRNARGCGEPSDILQVQVEAATTKPETAPRSTGNVVQFAFLAGNARPGRLVDIGCGRFHGVIHGASWQVIDGVSCLHFNGTSDFVEIPNLPHLVYGPGHELALYCKFLTTRGGALLSRNPAYHRPVPRSADTEFWLGIVRAADVAKRQRERFQWDKLEGAEGRIRWSGGTYYRMLREMAPQTSRRVDDGRWHELAVVLHDNRGQLFLDGLLEDTWISDWNTPHACSALIGARRNMYRNALDQHFEGAIAQLRIEFEDSSRHATSSKLGLWKRP
ncbi:MAG: hypothetical protein FJ276_20155 [Planctomycetes bacterium]|nr:hypothetical protein [Planctomycetota bacterium]